jgi:hypothetical protein
MALCIAGTKNKTKDEKKQNNPQFGVITFSDHYPGPGIPNDPS